MIKNVFKHSFAKYLFSYLICLILPVLIFSLLYKSYFITNYSDQLIQKAAESLDNTYEYVDHQINNLDNISFQLLSSRELYDVTLLETPPILTYYSVGELFNNYINTNDSIFDIWLYDKHNNYFYNSKQMMDMDSFRKYGPHYPNLSYEDFKEYMNQSIFPCWLQELNIEYFNHSYPLITYITAYPNSNIASNSILLFHLERSIFENPLKSVIQWEQSTTVVMNENGGIIFNLQ